MPDAPGIIRSARRPVGWIAPGPSPTGARDQADLQPQLGEDLCYLVGEWRIFQRQRGHRWSLDDLVTAWWAKQSCTALSLSPQRILDLGCGIGSVLLMNAWNFPTAQCLGIEAQALSAALASRSVRWNGVDKHVDVHLGDFRESSVLLQARAPFDLITGTPPYFSSEAGLVSAGEQKGPCRFEFRGGVEEYIQAALPLLTKTGVLTLCAAAQQLSRLESTAQTSDLALRRQLNVVPKQGKNPLIVVVSLTSKSADAAPARVEHTLVVRDAHDQRTLAMQALRLEMGLPP